MISAGFEFASSLGDQCLVHFFLRRPCQNIVSSASYIHATAMRRADGAAHCRLSIGHCMSEFMLSLCISHNWYAAALPCFGVVWFRIYVVFLIGPRIEWLGP